MTSLKNFDDLVKTLQSKGKIIKKATCIVQLFPNDGALMLMNPVKSKLSIGALLEPDNDSFNPNAWCLIPVVSINGSLSVPADYATIKEYLEEFIVCCKSCLLAFTKRNNDKPYFITSASKDFWIANNFMQVYYSLEKQWDVICDGIDSNPENCFIQLSESFLLKLKLT